MRTTSFLFAVLVLISSGPRRESMAQESPLPPPNRTPILILDHIGPHAPVTALAFAPDATTLYVGGLDKLVRRYSLKDGKYSPLEPLRVPVGQGNAGAVNAVAVSPDGKWVAVAGRAPLRGEVWSDSDDGIVTETRFLPPLLKRDFGVVYLFDPANPQGGRVIRGAESEVRAIAFATPAPADGPILVTAGNEWDAAGKKFGVVRVFNATTGKEIDSRREFPATTTPPGLAAWATGAEKKALRVAVAWPKPDLTDRGELVVWDAPEGKLQRLSDLAFNFSLGVSVGKDGAAANVVTAGYDAKLSASRLAVRAADPVGTETAVALDRLSGQFLLALAVAPLSVPEVGEATAVLVRIDTRQGAATVRTHELRLLGKNGQAIAKTALAGIAEGMLPVLTASQDGRFLAVGGFADHRVEVFDAAMLAIGKLAVQTIGGAPAGFAKVSFRTGNKLWLGGPSDTPTRGGIVLDFATRAASTNDGKAATDSTPDVKVEASPPDLVKNTPSKVTVAGFPAIALREGERPTAVALLPAKPAWNPALGAIVAVAHSHDESALTLVTLFDAATGKRLLQLGGPALPVRSLAFSSSRPLLVAAGADHAVAMWSLRDLNRELPAIEGVTVVARGATVEIAQVEPDSPARGKLAAEDVVEAVGGEKGELKAVKTPLEFVLAIRGLRSGDTARLQVSRAGKAAVVAVPVGSAIGHRHPLLTLWVDPVAKNGVHDWIGWTPPGPYDTNSLAAETRVGWLTATGDPTRPATYAAANQYRNLYYKKDFLRFLTDEADFGAANKKFLAENPPQVPTLVANLTGSIEKRGAKVITREKATGFDISLSDPSGLVVLDRSVLRWRAVKPDGKASDWQDTPFETGRAVIDLRQHGWARGEHRFELTLRAPYDSREIDGAAVFVYAPAAPILTLQIDGKAVAAGDEVTTKNAAVEVGASVKPGPEGGAGVTISTSGPGGEKPLSLVENPPGEFVPAKVVLDPTAKTTIRVTATTRGDGVDPAIESHSVEVTVRQLPPDIVVPPKVRVKLSTPHDPPTEASGPLLVNSPKVTVSAVVEDTNPVTAFEWDFGDGKGWVAGKLDATTKTATQEVILPSDGTQLTVRARAKSKDSKFAEDAVRVVFTGLPEVAFAPPPSSVTGADYLLTGTFEVAGNLPFELAVVVSNGKTGQSREFKADIDQKGKTWRAAVSLTPGDNQIGLLVRNKWRETRKPGLATVRYVRLPVVLAVLPVEAGVGSVADVLVTVATPAGVRPTELLVNEAPVGFGLQGKPVGLFGVIVQTLKAEGVAVKIRGTRLKKVTVIVRNTEGESAPATAEVRGKDPVISRQPIVILSLDGNAISPSQSIATDQARFVFDLKATSDTAMSRVELWHGGGPDAKLQPVVGVSREKAGKVAAGFEVAVRPEVDLRPGVNRFRMVVANSADAVEMEFFVRYNPPAARVVIDSISEAGPGGQHTLLKKPSGDEPVAAAGPFLELRGRVVWDMDDDPVARDQNLSVVAIANYVAHRPVVPAVAAGKRERAFVVPVYLNASDTQLRVELRSGSRLGTVPQQGVRQTELSVRCEKPLKSQRLHLLVVGVEVSERDRPALVRRVVEAVGGTTPADRPGFDRGTFKHPAFARAVLYRPLVADVERSDILGLLKDVEREIKQTTDQKGDEWVNDVVLVYYQGWDLEGKDGVQRLHTSKSLLYMKTTAPPDMVRIDELPPTPGVRVAVLNVADLRAPKSADPLAAALPQLRYPWKNAAATDQLLPMYQAAVARGRTLGDVVARVRTEVDKNPTLFGIPTDGLPLAVRGRLFGLQAP